MSYRVFFFATLLLPIIVGSVGYLVPALDGVSFLWSFAVIPYVGSATVLALLIWRTRTLSQLAAISICAPLLMSAFELAFLVAIDPPELRSFGRVLQLASVIPMTIVVASVFVTVSWILFAVARHLRWVAGPPAN